MTSNAENRIKPSFSSHSGVRKESVSIRVAAHGYAAAMLFGTFYAALATYLELQIVGIALFALSLSLPLLAFADRLVFDGKRIRRTGLLPSFWSYLNRSRNSLRIADIEQVETEALRTVKRGGKVFYRYRTTIRGRGVSFDFSSGGENYRTIILAIFPLLTEDILDSRSIDLRDYIREPVRILKRASQSNIPPSDVLEGSFPDERHKNKRPRPGPLGPDDENVFEKAAGLRRLANELRISGSLLRSLDTFRRAALMTPADAWLLFEFARCLQSYAGSEQDIKLERKAIAMMRLSEMRAGGDGKLLARLGENYFQAGEWRRAGIAFRKAVEAVGQRFRSTRGLAEIALREGKIAHVIHNFSIANRLAESPALKRWSKGELEYFSRLNNDEEYMEMEVGRVNLLDSLERTQRSALRITVIGFPVIGTGVIFDDNLLANFGWAISGVALLVWVITLLARKLFLPRISIEFLEKE